MAEELLKLYAAAQGRRVTRSVADSHWQQEFGDAFEYDLTVDQQTRDRRHHARHGIARRRWIACCAATSATARPKSAMRAAFKAGDRRQTGRRSWPRRPFLRFSTRDAEGTLRRLSREDRDDQPLPDEAGTDETCSSSSPTARSTSSSAPTGCCRRTCSSATSGLLVVDEEQRFGVAHKERIKQLRKKRSTC